MGVDSLTEYTKYGGPCQRQCDIDKKTLKCIACGMYFGVDEDE